MQEEFVIKQVSSKTNLQQNPSTSTDLLFDIQKLL